MTRFGNTFKNVNPQQVAAVIAEAVIEVDTSVFRQFTDTAVGFLAAHKLMIDPQGNDTRLEAQKGETDLGQTTYGRQFMELREALVVGVAVSGGSRGIGWGWGGGWW